jgi:hypothetical protein
LESSRQVLLKKTLGCAFPFLKLKLCMKHARIPWQSNIVQHAFFEIGNGVRFAPKRYHGQANTYIYVMVSSKNLPSRYLSCYVVHKLSHAAGYLGHIGLQSEGIFTTLYNSISPSTTASDTATLMGTLFLLNFTSSKPLSSS